jgi:hypothetical protein
LEGVLMEINGSPNMGIVAYKVEEYTYKYSV